MLHGAGQRGMNVAETLVYKLCRKSFLSLWSYMNPRQKPHGKELCDVLVVCNPDIIIFSVKHSTFPKNRNPDVNVARWKRRAIDASVAQIYGAERTLPSLSHVVKNDSSFGVILPNSTEARVHRVAIALGSEGALGMPYGDFGKGFVHVLDESATAILLQELDTISDFVKYLSGKEQFLQSARLVCEGPEEDLLAMYLHNGRQFPTDCDVAVVKGNVWKQFQAKPEYQSKKAADRESYTWDSIIEILCNDTLNDNLEFSSGFSGAERSIRTMAREDRFGRRVLGKSYREFIDESHNIRSRKLKSPSGIVYVFLALPRDTKRELRQAELSNRCFVARGQNQEATTVVGLATEQYSPQGFSFDLVHMYKPHWTPQDQEIMEGMQRDLGYFANPRVSTTGEDEYPHAAGT
jgi:hypothetical protein